MKDYREKELKSLLIILACMLLYWCTPVFEDAFKDGNYLNMNINMLFKSVLITNVLALVTFLMDSLIDNNLKDKLVCLFFLKLPGENIFTRIRDGKVHDKRFLLTETQSVYENIIDAIPENESNRSLYENSNWYKIYLSNQEKRQVYQSQRDSILCRDLFTETVIFSLMYIASLFIFKGIIIFSCEFCVLLIFIAIVTNISTHIKMDRFVNTVIAVDVASKTKEDD